MRRRLGRCIMFDNLVSVYVDSENRDGYGEMGWPEKEGDGYPTITIGLKEKLWAKVVEIAMHEVMEMCWLLGGHQWQPHRGLRNFSSGRFLFIADHNQFTEVVHNAADVMTYLMPELNKAWKKSKKGRKR